MMPVRPRGRFYVGRGDRGAVLVIVAAFAIVSVLMLAFVIDVGGLRKEKKEVTLSTDAAALAVASELDLRTVGPGTHDCGDVPVRGEAFPVDRADELARRFLKINGETLDDGCRVEVTGPRRGYVVIGGTEVVDYAFGPAVGRSSGRVSGVSASVARVDSGGGLRPIGLCDAETSINVDEEGRPYTMEDDVLGGERDADGYLVSPVDMVLALDHLIRDIGCSVLAPGQRGQLNLDPAGRGNGGDCGNISPDPSDPSDGTFTSEYRYGYFGTVLRETPTDSGNDFRTLADCFVTDIQEEQLFWMPVFDRYTPPPASTMRIVAYAQARLTGFCLSRAVNYAVPSSIGCLAEVAGEPPPGKRWLRLMITRVVDFDTMGPPLTDDALLDSPAICAEEDDATLLQECVPPNPPALGTPSDPNPPADDLCTVSEVAVSPSEVANERDNSLSEDVEVSVTLEDPDDCVDVAVFAVPVRGARAEATLVDARTNPVTAIFESGEKLNDGLYTIVVESGEALVPYLPPATFTVS